MPMKMIEPAHAVIPNAHPQDLLAHLGSGTVSMLVQPDSGQIRPAKMRIICGPPSQNLCAVRFCSLAGLQQFLVDNPSLSPSLLTSGPGEYLVWCRIDGCSPASKQFPDREWLADGGSVVIRQDQLKVIQAAVPVTIRFCNIVWPPEVARDLLRDATVARLGLPLTEGRSGEAIVNYRFLVLTFAEMWRLIYNPNTGQFLRFDPENCRYLPETDSAITSGLSNYVQKFLGSLPSDCGVHRLTASSTQHLMGVLRNLVPLCSSN